MYSPSRLRSIGRLEFDIARFADCTYVVINPTTPGTYLYLSDRDYVRLMNTCITQGQALILVAEPGELEKIISEREKVREGSGKPGESSNNSPFPRKGSHQRGQRRKTEVRAVHNLNKKLGRPKVQEQSAMLSLSDPRGLVAVVSRLSSRIIRLTVDTRKASNRIRVILNFVAFIWRSARIHGPVWTVMYLKACHTAIASYISGIPVRSLRAIYPGLPMYRLYNGLPHIIPIYDRHSIRRLDPRVIRFWMTLFSIYRVIAIPVVPKLSTITEPAMVIDYTGQTELSPEIVKQSQENNQE